METNSADWQQSISATEFGSQPYFTRPPTNNSPYMRLNQKGVKLQSRPKLKLTFSYFYAKSRPGRHVDSFSFVQQVKKEQKEVDEGEA